MEEEAEEDAVEEVSLLAKLDAAMVTEEDQMEQKTMIMTIWLKKGMEHISHTLNAISAILLDILQRNAQKVETQEQTLRKLGIFLHKTTITRTSQGHGCF